MDRKEHWQTLQTRLTIAHDLLRSGRSAQALEAAEAALAVDPDFLAAQALRDQILNIGVSPAAAPATRSSASAAVSADGYARFEERARRRRVDRRVEAVRAAISRRDSKGALAALTEIRELDPNLPELAALEAAFDNARQPAVRTRRAVWGLAAALSAAIVLGSTTEEQPDSLAAYPLTPSLALLPAGAPMQPIEMASPPDDVPADEIAPSTESLARTIGPVARPGLVSAPRPSALAVELRPDFVVPPPAPVALPETNVSDTPAIARVATPAAVTPTPVALAARAEPVILDEEASVRAALQRYRNAYDDLDAQSAREIWPGVDQGALARAFGGLESQKLTFDACQVRMRGGLATAVCRGTARYVTKVGRREPHVEPRQWSFTLQKHGTDWRIETARAQREKASLIE